MLERLRPKHMTTGGVLLLGFQAAVGLWVLSVVVLGVLGIVDVAGLENDALVLKLFALSVVAFLLFLAATWIFQDKWKGYALELAFTSSAAIYYIWDFVALVKAVHREGALSAALDASGTFLYVLALVGFSCAVAVNMKRSYKRGSAVGADSAA